MTNQIFSLILTVKIIKEDIIFILLQFCFSTLSLSPQGPTFQQPNFNTMRHELNLLHYSLKYIILGYIFKKYNDSR